MSKVDWSLAPEGATHARDYQRGVDFYKRESSLWLFWDRNKWDVAVGTSERDCVERPQPKPWSGPEDGLPPIGLPCEAELYHGGGWIEGFVAYYGKAHFIFESSQLTAGLEISGKIRTAAFRAIKTTDQIAADKRETAIRELMDIAQVDCRVTAARLVDAGFKREVV